MSEIVRLYGNFFSPHFQIIKASRKNIYIAEEATTSNTTRLKIQQNQSNFINLIKRRIANEKCADPII